MANQLLTLSTTINDASQQLNNLLEKSSLPCPSFEAGGELVDSKLGPELQSLRYSLMDAAIEMHDLLKDPQDHALHHNFPPSFVYDVCERFKVPENVPLNGEISYSDLSRATGMEENALTRILHYGILWRIFQEKRPGFISHSAISRALVSEDDTARSLAAMMKQDISPGAQRIADAHIKWPAATEPSQTAFLLAEDSDAPNFFAAINSTPARATRFAKVMTQFSQYEDISKDYPFVELGNGTLVELGGSRGTTAFKIARNHPQLNIVVQDMPAVIRGAEQQDNLKVSFMAHDFFQEQPVKGADAYMIRWCLHDWSDPYCSKILKALVPAMKNGTKLLIADAVVPPFGALPNVIGRKLHAFDIGMMILGNAKERTLEDWKILFATADSRFRLERVVPLSNSHLSVLELVWTP